MQSSTPVVHTSRDISHAHQSCTSVVRTIRAHQSCTVVVHTGHEHQSCTSVVRTIRAHQSCTLVMNTSRAHQSYTPVVHISRAHHTCTPVVHTGHEHQVCTTGVHVWCARLMCTTGVHDHRAHSRAHQSCIYFDVVCQLYCVYITSDLAVDLDCSVSDQPLARVRIKRVRIGIKSGSGLSQDRD